MKIFLAIGVIIGFVNICVAFYEHNIFAGLGWMATDILLLGNYLQKIEEDKYEKE